MSSSWDVSLCACKTSPMRNTKQSQGPTVQRNSWRCAVGSVRWRIKKPRLLLLLLPTLTALLWAEDRMNNLAKKCGFLSLTNWQHTPWTDSTLLEQTAFPSIKHINHRQVRKLKVSYLTFPPPQNKNNQTTTWSISTQLFQLMGLLLQLMRLLLFFWNALKQISR